MIYHLLNEQKKKGVAVIYVGEDLDVLLELCDRIVVLCGGKVNGILMAARPPRRKSQPHDQSGKGGYAILSSTAVREPLPHCCREGTTDAPEDRGACHCHFYGIGRMLFIYCHWSEPAGRLRRYVGRHLCQHEFQPMPPRDPSILLCVGIAPAPAFKMRLEPGGEGQILIGGLIAALVMVYQGNNLPTPVLLAAMTIGSMAAGALWGFVPAWFKSRWGTNETLFTLMMNYVATSIVACMTNIMRGQASSLGTLNKATKAGWFPIIMGQRYTINIIVVIVLTFAMYAYLKFSKQGYEISVVGESENTARYAGINVRRVTVRTMLISGAVCGLCGFLIVAGKDQTIATTSAGGRGFTAIIVAWLAKFNTFYMALISFLLVFLERGASEIASAYSLNEYAADIITGIILFFILGSEFFINYRLILRGAHKEGK